MPIDQIVACVSTGPASPSEAFIRDFYRNVPNEDLQARPVAALAAAVCSIWDFLQSHRPGRPRIRVIETPGWTKTRSVVEIINDDMPFLVDSVAAALNRLDHAIHLVIHPVIAVERDGDGQLVRLGGDRRESVMQIEVEGRIAGDDAGVATQTVEAVLADVRAAVIDWTAMRNKVERLADTLGDGGVPVAPDEIAEAAAFLTWLSQNNFTFLGYREYLIAADGMRVVPEIGKGILRNDSLLVFDGLRDFAQVSPEVQAFLRSPSLMMISKSNRRSTVHRSAPLDTIALKTFDEAGNVTGQRLIVGLFTSTAYASAPRAIPVLRRKVARCQERAGFAANSHDAKAFQHILDSFPRDELFQIEEDDLFPTALGIMRLQERQRIALFVRRDPFERFVSCLVYVPRDHYGEAVRTRFAQIIAAAFKGEITAEATQLDESSLLARIHFTIATPAGQPPVDVVALEAQLVEAGRVWADRLGEALIRVHGEEAGHAILRRFAEALPAAYMETEDAASAVADIGRVMQIEAGAPVALTLYRASGESGDRLYLKTFHAGDPLALSDVLPILEHFGLRVLNESPYACRPRGGNTRIWIQEFTALLSGGKPLDIASVALRFETAFASIWLGSIESDGFNRLVLAAGLTADQVVVLRAYAKLLRQAGSAFSQAYLADTLARHPDVAALLVRLFETLFDPSAGAGREAEAAAIEARIREHLDAVANLDEDRILRGFLRLITKSLRTSYYQRGTDRRPKPYLAIKLASREIDLLPLPRPLCEIFVYSPRMEGCHLRGGKVARGGIRWSDRREDFRTEILGLMKAQMVKNAVIVPVGSKGGFVVKRPPATRDALTEEVVACYRMLMSGLLDLTDTIDGEKVVPPPDVVRRDGDDPYLVVAADKGTATFSDIANGVAHEYGFWLGDAFASGGSVGYDHKAIGITARGAWEAVKRHFREIGTDIQTTPFTCIGVGDMSGDVFGNAMLLSPHTKLIAAFDHRHIFIDPDPDPSISHAERTRLFGLNRSSWADYDRSRLSPGGGIYERSLKAITLSAAAQAVLGIGPDPLSPAELIQVLLRSKVDLLWFGGIGTYVKATTESHAEAGDRTNDALRVDAATIRASVIGEGANLAMTQRARIEFALCGGRINTDAIDNSAGVDTSDHEVNIKIAVGNMIASGTLDAAQRASFLAQMTDEVGHLVLRDNYLQTQALSVAESQAARLLDQHARLMRALERSGRLDRAIEFLPDEETIQQRAAAGRGLTRPELAVLSAYAKNALADALLASDLPDVPECEKLLIAYFPTPMRELAPADLKAHRLRREIIATTIANEIVNRMGPAFIVETEGNTGHSAADIARAFQIAVAVFDLAPVWAAIEALDTLVPAATQTGLLLAVNEVAERAIDWLLTRGEVGAIAKAIDAFRPGIAALEAALPDLLPAAGRRRWAERAARFLQTGVPEALAARIVSLGELASGLDIVRLDQESGLAMTEMGRLYYETGECFGLGSLGDCAQSLAVTNSWQRLAVQGILQDCYRIQGDLTGRVIANPDAGGKPSLAAWTASRQESVSRAQEMVAEIGRAAMPDIAMLVVVLRQLEALAA